MNCSSVVLHVDDDASILSLVSRKLSLQGIKVVSISDPLKAIDAISESGARIVLLDIDMPVKDGLQLLQEIKQLDGGVQVIMCTGMVSMHTVLRSIELGAEACIFKPIVDLNEVSQAVERAFEKIDRWWTALQNWKDRKNGANRDSTPYDLESQLLMNVQSVFGSHSDGLGSEIVSPPITTVFTS